MKIPFWAAADLVTQTASPGGFQVSLEDIVPGAGTLVSGSLSRYSADGTPFEKGDVLFGKLRPYLAKFWLADREGVAGGDIHVYRPRKGVDPRYLAYIVGSRNFVRFAVAASKGVKMPRVEWMDIRQYGVNSYDERTQRRIADYLDRETGEIDAMLAKLDELTRSLKQRSGIVVANELKSHYSHGTIPLAFSSGADNFFDGDWVESKDQDPDGDIRLLQLADIGDGTFLDKSNRRINQEAFERLRCREVQAGDILIARMPHPLGRACILPTGLGRTITVVDVAVLRPDPSRIIPKYLVYVLNSISFRARLDSLQSGSTRQRISRSRLGQQRIPMPPVALQRATVSYLDEVTGRINAMLAKIDELKALLVERRSALITDVVTGRKKIPS